MFKNTLRPSNICLQVGFQKVQTISTKVLKENLEAARTKGHVGQQKSRQRQEKEELSCAPSPKSKHRAVRKSGARPLHQILNRKDTVVVIERSLTVQGGGTSAKAEMEVDVEK